MNHNLELLDWLHQRIASDRSNSQFIDLCQSIDFSFWRFHLPPTIVSSLRPVIFNPVDFLARLAALVPRPRVNLLARAILHLKVDANVVEQFPGHNVAGANDHRIVVQGDVLVTLLQYQPGFLDIRDHGLQSNIQQAAIVEAGFNTFLLKSEDVYIDLLTDSGVGAMSDQQWAGIMLGDEAYAGSRNFYHMRDTIEEYYSYKYTVPTHQELAGGTFVGSIIDEAHDPASMHPFKGNVDLNKLNELVAEVGAAKILYLCIATCVNMAGGQPISLENLRELRAWCDEHDILLVHDMTRVAENAYFIQQREAGYEDKSVRVIVHEICALTDAATMSSKQDAMVNIGGFLAMNDEELYAKACELVVVYEGLHTYGGMATIPSI